MSELDELAIGGVVDVAPTRSRPAAARAPLYPAERRAALVLAGVAIGGALVPLALFVVALLWRRAAFLMIGIAYDFLTLYWPLVALVAGTLMWRRAAGHAWLRRGALLGLTLVPLLLGLRVYATHIEPNRLVLREVTIVTPKVSRPVRILHISDIQADLIDAHEERAVAMMRALAPDLILHTGDLLQPVRRADVARELPKLAALLESLTPPLGKFTVVGDTDWRLEGTLDDPAALGGLRLLMSSDVTIDTGAGTIAIRGLSLPASRRLGDLVAPVAEWIERAPDDAFTILMGHAPDFALDVNDLPLDLCLAGHTHGGQVRLPFVGPLITLSAVPREWARGYREVGRTRLNVSAGIGAEHGPGLPPIRFLCPPEMTLITLVPRGTP